MGKKRWKWKYYRKLRYQHASGLFIDHYYFIWHAGFDDYWVREVKLVEGESLPRWRSLGYPGKIIRQKCL